MTTRRLVANDYSFGQSRLNLIDGLDALLQACVTRLRQFQGEWFLNEEDGTPWQEALAKRYDENRLKQIIRSRLLGVTGVTAVSSVIVVFTPNTRHADIEASVQTVYGQAFLAERVGLVP